MNFSLDFYIVAYSVIAIVFVAIMIFITFAHYNKKVLKKSYMDTRLYIYIVSLTAIFYIGTIFYAYRIKSTKYMTYIIYALIFLAYSISVMLILLVVLKPLKKIEDSTRELARGRKNLNIDFEGAIEFEDIAKNLSEVQNMYRKNDKKLNKKDVEYQKFVPKEYLKIFGSKKIEELDVGDNVQIKLCTMFCDLRNSYFSSETLSLADNFVIIQEFLKVIVKNVKKHNGFIDKFMGDGALAIFE